MSYIGNQSNTKFVSDQDVQDESIPTTKLANSISLFNHGQCRLAKDGANLKLSRYNGKNIVINGNVYEIPAAGVILSASGLSASTLYYIYVYQTAGTLSLEASTTTHTTDTTTGVEIKTGDATRTLVGMARPIAGPAWQDTDNQRFVRSWFNDLGISVKGFFTTNRNTSSTSLIELNSEIRNEFLIWNGEIAQINTNGSAFSGAAGQVKTSIGIDGTTPEDIYTESSNYTASAFSNIALTLQKTGLSEGYHYSTLLAAVTTSGANWIGAATAPLRCTLYTTIKK